MSDRHKGRKGSKPFHAGIEKLRERLQRYSYLPVL